ATALAASVAAAGRWGARPVRCARGAGAVGGRRVRALPPLGLLAPVLPRAPGLAGGAVTRLAASRPVVPGRRRAPLVALAARPRRGPRGAAREDGHDGGGRRDGDEEAAPAASAVPGRVRRHRGNRGRRDDRTLRTAGGGRMVAEGRLLPETGRHTA